MIKIAQKRTRLFSKFKKKFVINYVPKTIMYNVKKRGWRYIVVWNDWPFQRNISMLFNITTDSTNDFENCFKYFYFIWKTRRVSHLEEENCCEFLYFNVFQFASDFFSWIIPNKIRKLLSSWIFSRSIESFPDGKYSICSVQPSIDQNDEKWWCNIAIYSNRIWGQLTSFIHK